MLFLWIRLGGIADSEITLHRLCWSPELNLFVVVVGGGGGGGGDGVFFALKPRIGENIIQPRMLRPLIRNYFLVLISTFPVHSPSFLSKSSPYISAPLVSANVFTCEPAE